MPAWLTDARSRVAAVGLALAASVVLFFSAHTPLWLDEAQTVAIARRSLPDLFKALKQDGAPPLYYVLLHGWMAIFGTSSFAVRSLSGVLAVAALPLIAVVARRIPALGVRPWSAVLMLATCPFVVRYASEARMYSLVLLLVVAGVLAFERVWSRGGWLDIAAAAIVSTALLLTQYWSLYLLVVVGLGAIVAVLRGNRAAWRIIAALVIGAVLFTPWLPTFAYQSAHTGAPWGAPPGLDVGLLALGSWAGSGPAAPFLRLAYYALVVIGIAGFARRGGGLTIRGPVRRLPLALVVLGVLTLVVGTVAGEISSNAYAPRYSIIVLPFLLLVVAAGVSALTPRFGLGTLAVLCALGLIASLPIPFQLRTQAGEVADVLKRAAPTSLIVFCPDQLGPAVHRLVPHTAQQVVYPTFGSPVMVDWVDYKKRNEDSSPSQFAREALRRANGATIWYVYMPGYPTFHEDCTELYTDFAIARGQPQQYVKPGAAFEQDTLVRFAPR